MGFQQSWKITLRDTRFVIGLSTHDNAQIWVETGHFSSYAPKVPQKDKKGIRGADFRYAQARHSREPCLAKASHFFSAVRSEKALTSVLRTSLLRTQKGCFGVPNAASCSKRKMVGTFTLKIKVRSEIDLSFS